MKHFSVLQIAAMAVLGLAALHPVLKADQYDRKTIISISQPLEVPGVVLPPGTYVMKLLNSSSNRHIVQIMNQDQKQQLALTFAVPAERIRPAEKTILTVYEGSRGAPQAIRTWYYPGDTVGQEFLYPHRQAIQISERTNEVVPESDAARSTQTPTETPGDAVFIAKAEPAPEPVPAPVASPEPQQSAAEPQPAADNSAQSTQAAPATQPSDQNESLPKTAGDGPLALLTGGLALGLALALQKTKPGKTL